MENRIESREARKIVVCRTSVLSDKLMGLNFFQYSQHWIRYIIMGIIHGWLVGWPFLFVDSSISSQNPFPLSPNQTSSGFIHSFLSLSLSIYRWNIFNLNYLYLRQFPFPLLSPRESTLLTWAQYKVAENREKPMSSWSYIINNKRRQTKDKWNVMSWM